MLLNILRQKKGQALVQIAVMLAVLIGFTALVVDVGGMYLTKTQLQRMADAGALAGASRLGYADTSTSSRTMAYSYVEKNKLPSYSSDPDAYTPNVDYSTTKIKVTVSRLAFFNFAQVLGITPPTITATATASRLGGLSGLKPWALTGNEDFHYKTGEAFTLKEGGGGGTRGWFNAIQFKSSDNGASIYKSNIENGCPYTMSIGDFVYVENGNMASGDTAIKKATGLSENQDYSLSDYTNVSLTSPNVIFVPEVDSNLQIIGFAAVYITAYGKGSTDGKNGTVDVVFLNDTFWTGTNTTVTSEFKTKLEYQ